MSVFLGVERNREVANFFAFENQRNLGDVRAFELEARRRIEEDQARAAAEAREQSLRLAMEQGADVVSVTSQVVELDTTVPSQAHVRVLSPEAV
ncbi:MAG TPA: hypothetical protein VHD60_03755 [Candidatus Saccharimonadales bacterium]|nr:hypothetical protein [Candidatus Saccharimonadales bacterium]